jgi:DNA primase
MRFDVEGYVRRNLAGVRDAGGNEWQADCPFCGKSNHFYINAESGNYYCFKCEERGRYLVGVIATVEGISREEAKGIIFRDAANFRRPRKEPLPDLQQRVQELRKGVDRGLDRGEAAGCLPEAFTPVWDGVRFRTPRYLLDRGFTREAMMEFGMGLCNSGRYQGRVILPFGCPNGTSFTARDTTGHLKPKYLNPKGVDHGRLVYGWDQVKEKNEIALVEGPLDVVRLWEHGIWALGLLGKMLTRSKFALLCRLPSSTRVHVMIDPEERDSPYKIALQVAQHFREVRIALLPLGTDPGSSTRSQVYKSIESSKRYTGDRMESLMRAMCK